MRRTTRVAGTLGVMCAVAAVPVGPARAQGVPVVDTQNIAQAIRQLQHMLEDAGIQTEQLDTLLEQLEVAEQQFAKLEETYDALSGASEVVEMAMGGDLDGLLDQEMGDILDTIRRIQVGDFGGLTGDAAPELETQMEQVLREAGFDENTLHDMARGGNEGAQRVASQAGTGAVMSAAAQNSHVEAGQSLERVDRLVEMIPAMQTLKESVDHNTRVTAELAIAMTRMWELEAIQTVGAGQAGVVDAATVAEEERFMDFTLPTFD